MSTHGFESTGSSYLDGGRPIALHDLVRQGLLEHGDELVLEAPDTRRFHAVVSSDDQIILPDTRPLPDPNKAAQEVAGSSPLDGWSLWRRAKDGRSLDELRRALLDKDADRFAAREEDGGHLSLNLRRHEKLREARACADRHAPMKLTVRELLALWGTDRRGYDLIQLVQSDLANYGLSAKPGVREARPSSPRIPRQRTVAEWEEAERGRGLLIIDSLATRWGSRAVVDFPFCAGLGTVVWAEFTLTPATGTAAGSVR